MINIFDFATKELSQDAFLAWIFANCICEEKAVSDVSKALLNVLGLDTENITEVKVLTQESKIDISVYVTSNGLKQALYVEDKTGSKEHNQLIKYDKAIERISTNEKIDVVKKVYYKTYEIDQDERQRVLEADNWKIVESNEIYDFWRGYTDSSNQIISFYAKHILEIENGYTNIQRPIDNKEIHWQSFFNKVVIPRIQDQYSCNVGCTYYGYAYLILRPKGYGDGYPYLEIRSRDCVNNTFVARILTYGLDEHKYPSIREDIKTVLESRGNTSIFKVNGGEKRNKQLGITRARYTNVSDTEFFDLIDKCSAEFCDILKNAMNS